MKLACRMQPESHENAQKAQESLPFCVFCATNIQIFVCWAKNCPSSADRANPSGPPAQRCRPVHGAANSERTDPAELDRSLSSGKKARVRASQLLTETVSNAFKPAHYVGRSAMRDGALLALFLITLALTT